LAPEAPVRAPAGAERIRFVFTGLDLDGVTVYPPEVLEGLYADLIGKEISLADLYGVAAEIQRLYREDGFFLTRAIIPPQEEREGRLRVQVVEGYISGVEIQGDVGAVDSLVRDYLDHVLPERPLKLATLERALLLANDIPGLQVSGILRPARDAAGAAQLVATVERDPFDGSLLVDNIGSRFNGEWEVGGSASTNAFTRFGERITLSGLISNPPDSFSDDDENQKVGQLSTSWRLGSRGAYLNLLGSYGDSNPGKEISQFDFESTTLVVSTVVGYPVIRSRDFSLFADLGFDYIDSDTDIFNGEKFSRDRLRVLHLTGSAEFLDAWRGASFVSAGIRQGLPIFNYSEDDDPVSRPGADGVFTTIWGEASRVQPLIGQLSLFAKLGGQYAFENVLSDEEFGVGGIYYGRGYDPQELSDDHGVGFTGELRYTRETSIPLLERWQAFGFYDFGKVWDRGDESDASLASAGGGLRGWLVRNISLEGLLAKPLTRDSQRSDGSRDVEALFRAFISF
jgi:hemolysin activation/secretion protein